MTHTPSQMPDEIYVCNKPDGPDLNDVCGAALYKAVELEHNGWLHQTKYTRAAPVADLRAKIEGMKVRAINRVGDTVNETLDAVLALLPEGV